MSVDVTNFNIPAMQQHFESLESTKNAFKPSHMNPFQKADDGSYFYAAIRLAWEVYLELKSLDNIQHDFLRIRADFRGECIQLAYSSATLYYPSTLKPSERLCVDVKRALEELVDKH